MHDVVARLLQQSAALPSSPPSYAPAGSIEISFSVPYHCKYGQRMCVIGASDNLGAWNVANAVPMEWTEGDVWFADLKVPKE